MQCVGLKATPADRFAFMRSYSAGEILQKVLPKGVVVPHGYEQVGHLAHFNLREELLEYKHVIGQVLIEVRFTNFIILQLLRQLSPAPLPYQCIFCRCFF